MSDARTGPPAGHFRLRGEIGGVERAYPVPVGQARLGSVGDNDIVLPVRGISRHHALVTCDGANVEIEDLDSKNGVLVNGVRTRSARIAPGDEVRLGPVTLRLEAVPADDAELAIAVEVRAQSGLPSWQTTAVSTEGVGGRGASWLRLVDEVLERLGVVPEGDATGALARIRKELKAQGCALVEWETGADPLLVAACGEVPDVAHHQALQEFLQDASPPPREAMASALLRGDPPLACAALSSRGQERLILVVFGDYPARPESEPLLRTLLRLFERLRPKPVQALRDRPAAAQRGLVFPDGFVPGDSAPMASLYGQMRPLLQGDLPVLVLGETGVGKEHVARILHASSARSKGPFVAVNCAAIPAELLEAEMFGIGRGVATGVVERTGKFQLAEGGTLLLDEVGDMSLDLQAKLLRALQEKQIQPVGSAPVPVDIRVIAATNTDLQRRIEEGRFRRDLYYRVAGYVLWVPPLRERKQDVPALVESFIRAFSRAAGKSVRGITVKALRALADHDWPGNIRELEHEVRRLVYLCPDGQAIDSSMLSGPLLAPPPKAAAPDAEAEGASLALGVQVRRVEERLIREALARAAGNRTLAARLLGISRNGLAIKMQRLGIAD